MKRLGNPGRYQIFVLFLMCTNIFSLPANNFGFAFFSATPRHHCKTHENVTYNVSEQIPTRVVNNKPKFEECVLYTDASNHSVGTKECGPQGWNYVVEPRERTYVTEWDLVCTKKYQSSLPATIYFAGVMIGGPLFGLLSDRIGRRPVILLCLYAQGILGVLSAFSPYFYMLIGCKFLHGAALQGLCGASISMTVELVQVKQRVIVLTAVSFVSSIALISISAVSYLLRDWRLIQLVLSGSTIVTIIFIWLVPESLRWLLSQGKSEEAVKVSQLYARRNKLHLPDSIVTEVEALVKELGNDPSVEQSRRYGYMDLFRTPTIRKHSLIMFCLYFSTSFATFGVSFGLPGFGGNIYVSQMISGGLEFVSRVVGYVMFRKWGRKIPLSVFYIVGGLFTVATAVADSISSSDFSTITITLAVVAKAIFTPTYIGIGLLITELFPTNLRTTANGAATVFARASNVFVPQILILGTYTWKGLPMVLFALSLLVSGLLVLLLPETMNTSLPDTILEAEKIGDSKEESYKTSNH